MPANNKRAAVDIKRSSLSAPTSQFVPLYRPCQGHPTRHLIKDTANNGVLTVNLRSFGDFHTLAELVDAVTSDDLPLGWPVRLTHTIDPRTNMLVDVTRERAMPAFSNAEGADDVDRERPPLWFHGVTHGT
jgi:hypothetical protein